MVVSSRATICSVVALFLGLGIASGQQPKPSALPPLFPLFPLEQTWLISLDAPPAADASFDAAQVYVAVQKSGVVAVNRQTGQIAWRRELETTWPLVVGTGLVFAATEGMLHALDPASGETRWSYPLERRLLTAPVVAFGSVIYVLEQGDVVALGTADAKERWRLRVPNNVPLFPPVAGADSLYLSLDNGDVIAIDESGQLRWQRSLSARLTPPTPAPDRVFVGSTDNYLYALDADSGDILWKWRAGADVIGAGADSDRVFMASLDNLLRALNRGNGNQRWRKEIPTRPGRAPVVVRNVVVVTGVSPTIIGFAASDGSTAGTYVAPAEIMGAPLIDAELHPFKVAMIVLTRDGRLIGLTPAGSLYRETAPAPLPQLPGIRLAPDPRPGES